MPKLFRKEIYYYGNVPLERVVCPRCKEWCIVQKGKTPCCEIEIEFDDSLSIRRFRPSTPPQHRKPPTAKEKGAILDSQHFRCIYCLQEFGVTLTRNDYEEITLSVEFDHCVPFDYDQNNMIENFVAACQVCNGLKSNFHFRDLMQAREYLRETRKGKGYDW